MARGRLPTNTGRVCIPRPWPRTRRANAFGRWHGAALGWTWIDDAPWVSRQRTAAAGSASVVAGLGPRSTSATGLRTGPGHPFFRRGNGWSVNASVGPTFSWVPPVERALRAFGTPIHQTTGRSISSLCPQPGGRAVAATNYSRCRSAPRQTAVPSAAFVLRSAGAQVYVRPEGVVRNAPPAPHW